MAAGPANLVRGSIIDARVDSESRRTEVERLQEADRPKAVPGQDVYARAFAHLCPRLLRMVGRAPWLEEEAVQLSGRRNAPGLVFRQQAAATALGLVGRTGGTTPGDEHRRECVRASLIRWQLTLRGDGRPAQRKSWRDPSYIAIASQVVHLLTESGRFQTKTLLSDLAAHLEWLAQSPPQNPWIEATLISVLADGAVLARKRRWLHDAERRLQDLLEMQDQEGWFPERGGADIGRLSLTIDALARLYQQTGWGALPEPLIRAGRFLLNFVHPDGSVGGSYGSCGTAFLSPYGVELLASTVGEAATLAAISRRHCERIAAGGALDWHDDLLAVMGPRVAMASTVAQPALPLPLQLPCESTGRTAFPNAGLFIHATPAYHAVVGGRSGGALHVTWPAGLGSLDDPGLAVVTRNGLRAFARSDHHAKTQMTADGVVSTGVLRASIHKETEAPSAIIDGISAPP
ncbi:MAG: hypothetical protein KJ749_10795, partial [Planctomycetes bacterium]|nr:hypothetical protein [Planctomycetota bacterium]